MTFNNLAVFVFLFFSTIASTSAQFLEVETVTISGIKRTKEFVVLREMVLQKQQVISKDSFQYLIEMSKNRIMNLNLFNAVEFDTTLSNNKVQIYINVVEKWYDWPIPFVEFSDRNFNVWKSLSFDPGRTNYGIYLFNYNVWGLNHTLKTSVVYGYNKTYGLEYRIPFFSKKSTIGISSTLKYTSQSELWLSTRNDELQFFKNDISNLIEKKAASIRLNKRLTPYTMGYVNFYAVQTTLDSSLLNIASHYLLDNKMERTYFEMGFSLDNDKRNSIYLPTKGTYLVGSASTQYYNGTKPIYSIYLSAKAQKFNNLHNKWFSAFSFFGEFNSAKLLPYENSRRLGYNNLVRGFETYVVEGKNSILGNAALRYQVLDRKRFELPFIPIKSYNFLPVTMFAELFVDAGYVSNPNVQVYNKLPNTPLYSSGLSLQTAFYNDRVLRVEYSFNSLKESGLFVHFKKAI